MNFSLNNAPYLQNAKAFLMLSKSETFGVAYAESLLCGTPIMYSEGTSFVCRQNAVNGLREEKH